MDPTAIITAWVGSLLAGKGPWLLAGLTVWVLIRLWLAGYLRRPALAIEATLTNPWAPRGVPGRVVGVTAWVALTALVAVVAFVHVPTPEEDRARIAAAQSAAWQAAVAPAPIPDVVAGVIEADSAPTSSPTGTGTAGITKAPTPTVAPLPAAPAASKRLLSIWGGECLSSSNPDYRGNARATVEARWRHCLPVMFRESDAAKAPLVVATNKRTVLRYAAPAGTVLTDAQLRAKLSRAERAEWDRVDAQVVQWEADRALLESANDAAMGAFGGYWSP